MAESNSEDSKARQERSQPGEEDLELDFHSEDVLDKPFDRHLAARLFRYVMPYRLLLAVSLALIVVATSSGK